MKKYQVQIAFELSAESDTDAIKKVARTIGLPEWFNEFDNMNYFLVRAKPYNPKGRVQTEDKACGLDNKISTMLAENDVRFKIVPGNYEGINDITKRVLRKLGKEMKIYLKE